MRDRYKHQIRLLDTWAGKEFDRALSGVIAMENEPLDFFTTEQLEAIRGQMIRSAWLSHRINRENRKRLANNGRAA